MQKNKSLPKKTNSNKPAKQLSQPSQGEVRVIGGKWRRRKLPVINAEGLRPTSDRTKETLFNWLQFKLAGANCLDAFSGSGALAIEALSRGAARVLAWDTQRQAIAQLNSLKAFAGSELLVEQACALTQLQASANQQFNLVFLDPPFAYTQLNEVAEALTANNWLAEDAFIYVEVGKEAAASFTPPANWQLLKQKNTKEVAFALYQFDKANLANP